MCGIVGLHLKAPGLEARLGELMVPMLEALALRGPDSTGIAVYREDVPADRLKFSLQSARGPVDWESVAAAIGEGTTVRAMGDNAVLATVAPAADVLATLPPDVRVVGWGRTIEVVKDVGD